MSSNDDSLPRADVLAGLLYAHTRANLNTIEAHRALSAAEALAEVLVERGVIDRDAFEAHRRTVEDRLRQEYVERGMSVAIAGDETSKYAAGDAVEIDCESRIPLCQAACCRLQFALSKEDVEEGIVRWELGRPYFIAHRADGYCVHVGGEGCRCQVYAHRPLPCRQYDCRRDARIWIDFEARRVNPRVGEPGWPMSEASAADASGDAQGDARA